MKHSKSPTGKASIMDIIDFLVFTFFLCGAIGVAILMVLGILGLVLLIWEGSVPATIITCLLWLMSGVYVAIRRDKITKMTSPPPPSKK